MLKNIEGTPALAIFGKVLAGGAGGEVMNLLPNAAFSIVSAVATTAGSFMTALAPSVIMMSGAGAPDIAAAAFAVRSMPARILARTSGLKLRMVPNTRTSSGMMFSGGAAVDRANADHAEFESGPFHG